MSRQSSQSFARGKSLATALLIFSGCADASSGSFGSLDVLLEAEDTVREGIAAGDATEAIVDGWDVAWQNYILTIGHVRIVSAVDSERDFEAEERFVVDLTDVPNAGLALWSFAAVDAGRWNVFYEVGEAGDGAMRDDSVSKADFSQMVDGDLTYLIRGSLTQSNGQSCPPTAKAAPGARSDNGNRNARGDACYDNDTVELEVIIAAEALFGPCEVDEIAGVAVPSGGSQSAALTIHGDHMFFNGFPQGAEGGVSRRAQWIADADLNLDGKVGQQELEQLQVSDMAEFDEGYQFGGAPEGALSSLWTYVAAQLRTQGHFQGEGECPIDGVGHEH